MSHKAIKTPEGDNPAQVLAAELARPSRFIDPLIAALSWHGPLDSSTH